MSNQEGAVKSQQKNSTTAPAKNVYKEVPNIIKKEENFVCGVCTTEYSDYKASLMCLSKCLNTYFQNRKIRAVKKNNKIEYKCDICGAVLNDKDAALKHYIADKSKIIKLLKMAFDKYNTAGLKTAMVMENKKPKVEIKYRKEGQEPFRRHDAKYICAVCGKSFFTKMEVEECFMKHPLLEMKAKKPKEEEVKYRKEGQEPFRRHDAKYVCTVCGQKFFTKMEVEECFMKHPVESADDAPQKPTAPSPAPLPVQETTPKKPETAQEASKQVIMREPGQTPFNRDGAKYVCSACRGIYFTKMDVEACFQSHPESDGMVNDDAPKETPSPQKQAVAKEEPPEEATVAPPPGKEEVTRSKGQEPFHRDGAKYVCSACGTVYFTKFEVEQCFTSHPEE